MKHSVVDFILRPEEYNDLPVDDLLEIIFDPAVRALRRVTGPAELGTDYVFIRVSAKQIPEELVLEEDVNDG